MSETLVVSGRGQITLPAALRKRLGIKEGDVVILKKIQAPDRQEFRALARKVRSRARCAGMKRSDVKRAVRATRRRG